ncbi:hypothetical protein [Aquitalea aquatica]|uniref:Uncharacterized protein n=1 Tax=Aquitalea aquatica TaxID=3044273 RepID=A0A838Y9S9_9NEIS|nr:hypothetical protein [Aquitalea magnusonii]MBA4707534.1 hypothetical protein [Aquitalea magnusonii]
MSEEHVETRILVPSELAAQVEIARARDGKPLNEYWVETMDRKLNGVIGIRKREQRDKEA